MKPTIETLLAEISGYEKDMSLIQEALEEAKSIILSDLGTEVDSIENALKIITKRS